MFLARQLEVFEDPFRSLVTHISVQPMLTNTSTEAFANRAQPEIMK